MAWIKPEYSKRRVDRAGRALAEDKSSDEDLRVLNNWRSAHAFPLNTLQNGLRQRASRICEHPLVSQRLKRTPSTVEKLRRFPSMKLSQMQDIGGCRAVVKTVEEVRNLQESHRRSRMKHRSVNGKDYIAHPRDRGTGASTSSTGTGAPGTRRTTGC